MNYWLHPEAEEDLREAAEFYRIQAGTVLSQALFAEFERSLTSCFSIQGSVRFGVEDEGAL
jgi:hypothetical protein